MSDPKYTLKLQGEFMTELSDRRCVPCEGGVEPLTKSAALKLLAELNEGWVLSDDARSIAREFRFPVFSRTIAFVNAVAWVATVEGHHPELLVNYGSCNVRYITTAIDGLSENDFICAAKVDLFAADQ